MTSTIAAELGDRPGANRPTAPPGRPLGDRLPLVVVGVGVALLPLLNPKGPLNTGPVDLVLMAGILVVLVWAGTDQLAVHVPYALPVAGLAVAGLTAALVGDGAMAGFGAAAQELVLLAWCAAVVCVCRTPLGLRTLTRVWCLSATGWAALLVVLAASGHPEVPGGKGGAGDRARLWFDHPNLAGNYFMLAVFVVLATRYPRRPVARAATVCALVLAMFFAGSNAALLSLPIGGLVIVHLRARDRRGPVVALALTFALAVAGGALWATVGEQAVAGLQHSDHSLLRYSVARSSRSAEGRESLFAASLALYQQGDVVGIGPSSTSRELEESGLYDAKEAHNDYLGTLVERGPLGIIALVVLAGAVAVRVANSQRPPPGWAPVVPCPEALAAAAAAYTFTALTHEVLHYRHLWTYLAVVAALDLATRDHARVEAAAEGRVDGS